MKKSIRIIIAAMMAAVLVFSLAACGSDDSENTQTANPYVEYESFEEATEAAGFDITVPDAPDGYDDVSYSVMDGNMIEIIWSDASGNEAYRIRKQPGSGDISGDYNDYSEAETVGVGGKDVTVKGNDGAVYVAIWEADGYTYAIDIDMGGKGLSKDEVISMAETIK